MLNFTKTTYFKIIALTVAATLCFESAVYGTDLSDLRHLRVPFCSVERVREGYNICVGSTRYDSIGGLQNYLKLLYEEIARRIKVKIHIVYFTTRKKVKGSIKKFDHGMILTHPIYQRSGYLIYISPSTMLAVIRELADIKRKDNMDLIHLHDPYIPVLTLPYVLLKIAGIPIITTFHVILEWVWSWKYIAMRIFLGFIRVLLGKRFGVSKASARLLGKKAEVIGSLIDTSLFDPEEANPQIFLKKNNITAEHIILYPSRIAPIKGQLDLVEVAKKIKKNRLDLDFKIVIIGPINDKSYLEKIRTNIRSSKLEDCIIILPPLQDEELRDAYASADIVVLPSYSEGLPLVILEAFAMKKPVVANAVGGVSEVIIEDETKGTGYLVEPHNTGQMADKIIDLLDDPAKRERFGENGRRFVLKHYSVDSLVRRHLELYSSLVHRQKEIRINI